MYIHKKLSLVLVLFVSLLGFSSSAFAVVIEKITNNAISISEATPGAALSIIAITSTGSEQIEATVDGNGEVVVVVPDYTTAVEIAGIRYPLDKPFQPDSKSPISFRMLFGTTNSGIAQGPRDASVDEVVTASGGSLSAVATDEDDNSGAYGIDFRVILDDILRRVYGNPYENYDLFLLFGIFDPEFTASENFVSGANELRAQRSVRVRGARLGLAWEKPITPGLSGELSAGLNFLRTTTQLDRQILFNGEVVDTDTQESSHSSTQPFVGASLIYDFDHKPGGWQIGGNIEWTKFEINDPAQVSQTFEDDSVFVGAFFQYVFKK